MTLFAPCGLNLLLEIERLHQPAFPRRDVQLDRACLELLPETSLTVHCSVPLPVVHAVAGDVHVTFPAAASPRRNQQRRVETAWPCTAAPSSAEIVDRGPRRAGPGVVVTANRRSPSIWASRAPALGTDLDAVAWVIWLNQSVLSKSLGSRSTFSQASSSCPCRWCRRRRRRSTRAGALVVFHHARIDRLAVAASVNARTVFGSGNDWNPNSLTKPWILR